MNMENVTEHAKPGLEIMCGKGLGWKNEAFGRSWVIFNCATLDGLLPISTSYLPGGCKIFNNLTFSKLCHEQ